MRWDDLVRSVLPGTGDKVVVGVRSRWSGARVYVTMRAARLDWAQVPCGAAERFAFDLDAAVRAVGGDESHTRAILLPLAGTHLLV